MPRDFFGKYRLGDRIARGGMAEIYHAHVTGAGGFAREIVVKRILPELVEDAEFREMFKDEAHLASYLDHPNIVQIFDFDHVGDSFYIAMEYVRGADLSKLIRAAAERRERLPVDVVVLVISEVLTGLRYAHDLKDEEGHPLNLVHRDISPANILLSYTGAVKLADFGIAKAATSLVHTSAGVLKGKYPYMSPEQAAGQPIDRRSDLFATGVVLYQALLGRRPFRGKDTAELLDNIMSGRYAPARTIAPTLPESLVNVINRALRVDPNERYQSADEFLQDLRASLDRPPTREALEECLKQQVPEKPRVMSVSRPRGEVAATVRAHSLTGGVARRDDVDATGETMLDDGAEGPTQQSVHANSPVPGSRVKAWPFVVGGLVLLVAVAAVLAMTLGPFAPAGAGGRRQGDAAVAPARSFTLLARRSTDQENMLREHGLDAALGARGLELRLMRFDQYGELFKNLRSAQVDLVSVPVSMAKALVQEDLVVPVEQVAAERLQGVRSRFTAPALELAAVDLALGSNLTYIPDYVEVYVLAYRISKVELARARWGELRSEIEAALAAVNGRGLPEGYELEASPDQWDEFDIFVMGYTWAHLEAEGVQPAPRLAMRSESYWPSVEGLIEASITHGQSQPTWVRGQPLSDALTWLALHREHDLQRPEVWAETPSARANGTSITRMFGRGELYLTRMNQFRCAELRQWIEQFQPGFALNDVAFAQLPAGVSVTLDATGRPERSSGHDGLVNAWLWAIPRSAPDPQASLEIALELVDVPNQTYFASANCWIPTNTGVDTSERGDIEPYCRRAIAPGLERLTRTVRIAYPPDGDRLNNTVTQFERLWTDLFFARGYRPEGGQGISIERLQRIIERYVPES